MTFGNWFKNNWVNCIKALGATATTVGFTGAMIRDMSKGGSCCRGSIFDGLGGRFCYNGYGNNFLTGAFGCSPMFFMNNFGASGWDTFGTSQYSGQMAYMAGAQAFNDQYMQAVLNGANQYSAANTVIPGSNTDALADMVSETFKVKNEYAGDIAKDQDTTLGTALDEAMNTADGSYKFAGITKDNYKEVLSNAGKSFGAVLDTNDDGYVSEDEFITSELNDLPDADKTSATNSAKIAFDKIDINGDKKLDWKELAANFAAFDYCGSDKLDGNITNEQFKNMSRYLQTSGQNYFDNTIRQTYNYLFKKPTE